MAKKGKSVNFGANIGLEDSNAPPQWPETSKSAAGVADQNNVGSHMCAGKRQLVTARGELEIPNATRGEVGHLPDPWSVDLLRPEVVNTPSPHGIGQPIVVTGKAENWI